MFLQAEDRAHRIGQQNTLFIHYCMAEGTADDIMWPAVNKKLQVVAAAVDGHSSSGLQLTSWSRAAEVLAQQEQGRQQAHAQEQEQPEEQGVGQTRRHQPDARSDPTLNQTNKARSVVVDMTAVNPALQTARPHGNDATTTRPAAGGGVTRGRKRLSAIQKIFHDLTKDLDSDDDKQDAVVLAADEQHTAQPPAKKPRTAASKQTSGEEDQQQGGVVGSHPSAAAGPRGEHHKIPVQSNRLDAAAVVDEDDQGGISQLGSHGSGNSGTAVGVSSGSKCLSCSPSKTPNQKTKLSKDAAAKQQAEQLQQLRQQQRLKYQQQRQGQQEVHVALQTDVDDGGDHVTASAAEQPGTQGSQSADAGAGSRTGGVTNTAAAAGSTGLQDGAIDLTQ